MIVEVVGIYEHNKGALLMLEGIRQALGERLPDAVLAVPASMPRPHRRKLNVLGVVDPVSRRGRLLSSMPALILRMFGLVSRRQVRVLLDASGFGYGDYWGIEKLRGRLLRRLRTWPRRDKHAVLLPQAFGPFEQAGMADAFREAVSLSDLVYVRDAQSMHFVEETRPDLSKLRRAPDFTNLLHPPLAPRHRALAGYRLVIPNEKMVGEDAASRAKYVRFMALATSMLAVDDKPVAILIHEGEKDRGLGDQINAALPSPIPVIDDLTALEAKSIISVADLIISSRFHGLVSALSNVVPAIACGWSHKYAELMADYGVGSLLVRLDNEAQWAAELQAALMQATDPSCKEKLSRAALEQRKASTSMWNEVSSLIKRR